MARPPWLLIVVGLAAGCGKSDPPPVPGPNAAVHPAKEPPAEPPKAKPAPPPKESLFPDVPPLPAATPDPAETFNALPPDLTKQLASAGKAVRFVSQPDYAFPAAVDPSAAPAGALPGFDLRFVAEKAAAAWPVIPKPFGLRVDDTVVTPAWVAALAKQVNLRHLYLGSGKGYRVADLRPLATLPNVKSLGLWLPDRTKPADLAAVLSEFAGLESLSLQGKDCLDDGVLERVGKMTALRRLELWPDQDSRVKITDAGVRHLEGLPNLRGLFVRYGLALTDKGLASLGKIRTLEELHVGSLKVGFTSIRHLAPLGRLRRLTYDCSFYENAPEPMREELATVFARFPELEALDLNTYGLPKTFFAALAGCRKLKRLDLHLSYDTPYSVAELAQLTALEELKILGLGKGPPERWNAVAQLPNLRWLGLAVCEGLTDAALRVLYACPKLESLDILDDDRLTDAGFDGIAKLGGLKALAVSRARLGDAAVREIAKVRTLERLSLRVRSQYAAKEELKAGGGVTDDGVLQLTALTKLTWLDLPEPIGYKKETLATLRAALSGCKFSQLVP